ncbi:MAG: hypothetical protein BRD21_05690 [Halobacteriales archaeon SW_8_66_22]|nr:MAG: hypothetical protein BRD21_05690 [Halobacteriales archaeon SW_8_66_22]
MCALRDAEFFEFHDDLVLLGVSGDGIDSHERFATRIGRDGPPLVALDRKSPPENVTATAARSESGRRRGS